MVEVLEAKETEENAAEAPKKPFFQRMRANGLWWGEGDNAVKIPLITSGSYIFANPDRFIKRLSPWHDAAVHTKIIEVPFYNTTTMSAVRVAIESDPTGTKDEYKGIINENIVANSRNFVVSKKLQNGDVVAQYDTKRDIGRVKKGIEFISNKDTRDHIKFLRDKIQQIRDELLLIDDTITKSNGNLNADQQAAIADALRTYRNVLVGIEGRGGALTRAEGIFDILGEPIKALQADLAQHQQSMDDIFDPPAKNDSERTTGGTVVARLAAAKAETPFKNMKAFCENVSTQLSGGTTDIRKTQDDLFKVTEDGLNAVKENNKFATMRLVSNLNNQLQELDTQLDTLFNANFDDLIKQANEAAQSRKKFTEAFLEVTTVHADHGSNIYGPTQLRLQHNVGRAERAATNQDWEAYKKLREGDPIKYPKLPNKDWRALVDVFSSNPLGSNGPIKDATKFLAFAYAQNGGYEVKRKDATAYKNMIANVNAQVAEKIKSLLTAKPGEKPDNNAVIQGLALLALQYVANADDDDRNLGINIELPEFLKKFFESHKDIPWNDDWNQVVDYMYNVVNEAGGSNNVRLGWHNAWKLMRNAIFGGDLDNEVSHKKPGENVGAKQWRYGIGLKFKFLGPILQAEGLPYYLVVAPFKESLEDVANFLGWNRIPGMFVRGMWQNKIATLMGTAVLGLGGFFFGPAILAAAPGFLAAHPIATFAGAGILATGISRQFKGKDDDEDKTKAKAPKKNPIVDSGKIDMDAEKIKGLEAKLKLTKDLEIETAFSKFTRERAAAVAKKKADPTAPDPEVEVPNPFLSSKTEVQGDVGVASTTSSEAILLRMEEMQKSLIQSLQGIAEGNQPHATATENSEKILTRMEKMVESMAGAKNSTGEKESDLNQAWQVHTTQLTKKEKSDIRKQLKAAGFKEVEKDEHGKYVIATAPTLEP